MRRGASAGPGRRPDVLGLLRQRNFRLLWFGETVSNGGSATAGVLVPLLAVTTLRATTFEVAALTAASYLPWLLIGLPAGAWVDRLPVRPLMIGCDLAAAALYASLPVLAWLRLLTIGDLLVIALLAGGTGVLFATAYQVYLPSLVDGADLVEGNAKLQGSASMALIGGRGAAGLAADGLGAAPAVLFNAVSFLVSAACLLKIRATPPKRTGARRASLRTEIAQGGRLIARDPYLRPVTLYAAAGNLTYSGYNALLVVFLVKDAGLSAAAAGLLMSTVGAGGLAGALIARRIGDRLGTLRALQVSTLATSLFGLLIPLTRSGPEVACYVAGAFGVSAGTLIGNILASAFRQAYCPPEMLGRVVANMRFASWGTIPLGAMLAGALGTALGVRTALWMLLGGYVLSGLLLLTFPGREEAPPFVMTKEPAVQRSLISCQAGGGPGSLPRSHARRPSRSNAR
jgi:predicted MFS family arabinose efflux permease